jgi:hypothetical protein
MEFTCTSVAANFPVAVRRSVDRNAAIGAAHRRGGCRDRGVYSRRGSVVDITRLLPMQSIAPHLFLCCCAYAWREGPGEGPGPAQPRGTRKGGVTHHTQHKHRGEIEVTTSSPSCSTPHHTHSSCAGDTLPTLLAFPSARARSSLRQCLVGGGSAVD